MTARPLVVIGASGIGWELLEGQFEAGRMPNLARIVRSGVSATLLFELVDDDRHFRPQVAWVTLATGCSPRRHGVTRFFHEGGDLREKSLWEYWQGEGPERRRLRMAGHVAAGTDARLHRSIASRP
jgi:predicted AlkP superfamily phosphohydrolase/phosphomutase